MTLEGIDIASHQGPNFDFGAQKARGVEFCIIKASGGHAYRNPHLAAQVEGARNADMLTSFYHYLFEPTSGGGSVTQEANNFIEACRPYVQPGSTFWLDVEELPASVGFTGDLGAWIVSFCEAVERAYGCVCGIYCATWYLVPTGLHTEQRLTKYPLWFASWQDAVPGGSFLAPWDHLTIWQYNAGGIDKDRFFGTRAEFLALGVPAAIEHKTDTGFQHAEGFLDPLVDTFDWEGAGIVTYRKVRAYNDQERATYEREWDANTGYSPWIKLG